MQMMGGTTQKWSIRWCFLGCPEGNKQQGAIRADASGTDEAGAGGSQGLDCRINAVA